MTEIKTLPQSPKMPVKSKPTSRVTTSIQVEFGFREGLNFGCGFFTAGAVFTLIIVPLATFIILTSTSGILSALLSSP